MAEKVQGKNGRFAVTFRALAPLLDMGRITLILAVAALFALGCAVEPVELGRTPGAADSSHTCAGSCDHIFVDGGWKVVANHRHGPECGHVLVDGRWVKAVSKVADPPKDR